MGWYTLDSHSMTAKLVSHNEGQRLSEDAHESGLVKGQIISKELFVVLEFSQKMNEQIRLTKNEQICRNSKNEFVYSNTPRYAPPRYAYPADTPL